MELFDEIIQNKQLEDTITERPKNRIRKQRLLITVLQGFVVIIILKEFLLQMLEVLKI